MQIGADTATRYLQSDRLAERSGLYADRGEQALDFDIQVQLVVLRDNARMHGANADWIEALERFDDGFGAAEDRFENRFPIVPACYDRHVIRKIRISDQGPWLLTPFPCLL